MKNKKWKVSTKIRKTTKKEKIVGLIGWFIVIAIVIYFISK